MTLFGTVNIIGATIYFVFAVLLAWLSRIPRTNPGAGWWAIAIFCGTLARLALLLPGDYFPERSGEYVYGVCILLEKCFLLVGIFRFFNLHHYTRPYLGFIGAGLVWIIICSLTDISRLLFSFGLGLFNAAALFFLAFIAYRER
ncbi:MAG TPA: GGDEF domain-containing protein, partial [Cellvibrio sp.]